MQITTQSQVVVDDEKSTSLMIICSFKIKIRVIYNASFLASTQ